MIHQPECKGVVRHVWGMNAMLVEIALKMKCKQLCKILSKDSNELTFDTLQMHNSLG